MKRNLSIVIFIASVGFLSSCVTQPAREDYDVSNPYAAPDYADDQDVRSAPDDVNLSYDAPAAYEDTASVQRQPSYQSSGFATTHTVVRGDSLWKISKQYGVSIDEIKQANGLSSDVAVLGARLRIPSR